MIIRAAEEKNTHGWMLFRKGCGVLLDSWISLWAWILESRIFDKAKFRLLTPRVYTSSIKFDRTAFYECCLLAAISILILVSGDMEICSNLVCPQSNQIYLLKKSIYAADE